MKEGNKGVFYPEEMKEGNEGSGSTEEMKRGIRLEAFRSKGLTNIYKNLRLFSWMYLAINR